MKRTLIAIAAALTVTAVALPAIAGQGYGPGWFRGTIFQAWNGGDGPQQGWGQGRGRMGGAGMQGFAGGNGGPQAAGGGFGRGQGYGPGAEGGRFAAIDADQNGAVSATEAATAIEGVYAAMDGDDNGSLTRDEYMSVRMGPQEGRDPARQARMQTRKDQRFTTLDANGDGTVSRAEFIDGGKARFARADTDGDGSVTPWEFRRHAFN